MKYLLLISILLLVTSFPSKAQFAGFDKDTSQKIVEDSIGLFWSSDSKIIENDQLVPIVVPRGNDIEKPILQNEDAMRIVSDSYIVGNAMWCEIEWKPYYLDYMQKQRKEEYNQVQIAYIGFLFGAGQYQLFRTLEASGQSCPSDISQNIKRLLTSSKNAAGGSDGSKTRRPF